MSILNGQVLISEVSGGRVYGVDRARLDCMEGVIVALNK